MLTSLFRRKFTSVIGDFVTRKSRYALPCFFPNNIFIPTTCTLGPSILQSKNIKIPDTKEQLKNNLHNALLQGKTDLVKYLFLKGVRSYNMGYWAVYNNHLDILKFLYDQKHFIYESEALKLAISKGHTKIISYLLEERKMKPSFDILMEAITENNLGSVEYLVSKGYRIKKEHIIRALLENKKSISDYFYKMQVPNNVIIDTANQRYFIIVSNTAPPQSVQA